MAQRGGLIVSSGSVVALSEDGMASPSEEMRNPADRVSADRVRLALLYIAQSSIGPEAGIVDDLGRHLRSVAVDGSKHLRLPCPIDMIHSLPSQFSLLPDLGHALLQAF
jgi:hypothetical protein